MNTLENSKQTHEIKCEEVSKTFYEFGKGELRHLILSGEPPSTGFEAVKGINFEVPKGEFLGLLGKNGAGKSTILRTVGGIYQPDSGVIHINGAVSGLYELGVSGQQFLTGRQFAERWLKMNNMVPIDIQAAIEDLHVFTELGAYFDKRVLSYSSGMRARLFFGVATAVKRKIFLIDEVLSVGDIYFTAKCWRRLRDLVSNGATGLLATHDWTSILKLCDKACIVDGGRFTDFGPAPEVVQRYLSLPEPNRQQARFLDGVPQLITAKSGADLKISFPLESFFSGDIYFGFSIEQFSKEVGWEHIIHLDPQVISNKPGIYEAHVELKELPIIAGEYLINIFLSRGGSGMDEFKSCDVLSWLYGNPIKLVVSGNEGARGNYVIPVTWKVCDA